MIRSAIAALAVMLPVSAMAQPVPCGDRSKMLEGLERKYDEKIVAFGVHAIGNLVEITASEDGGWTMLVTNPDLPASVQTCVVAVGEGWQLLLAKVGNPA